MAQLGFEPGQCGSELPLLTPVFTTSFFLNDFLKDFIYLFIFRERGREGEREGEKHQCVVASHVANWGPGSQPRHVP